MNARTYYAIGDIHGEAERLALLYDQILASIEARGAPATIVHLGDFIDRGPDSRGVIALVMSLGGKGAFETVSIKGNHEELMLHAFDKRDSIGMYYWSENGGDATIASYRAANGLADDWRDIIDRDHLSWMRALPTIFRDDARKIAFVHGGIDPAMFPDCEDDVRIWTRSDKFFNVKRWPNRPELNDWLIVHGHTPTDDKKPYTHSRRINVDTGVCYGGPLTCVILAPDEAPRFLAA